MNGLYINGKRPTSKKAVKAAVAADPSSVSIDVTSMFGHQPYQTAAGMAIGDKEYFVGPDPYTSRKFYGTIERTEKGWKVS